MHEPKHHESKADKQLERMINFSDGIFAISITLMVIEIKVPSLIYATDQALWHNLREMGLKILGFLISYAIVGHYAIVHHRIFGYVKKCTTKLLWINLGFLLSVVLLPFSSGLLGEFSSEMHMQLPYGIYVFNICFTAVMNYVLWNYVSHPNNEMLTHTISPSRIRLGVYRTFILPSVFVISLGLSFVFPVVARFIPVLIPLITRYGMRQLEHRANKEG